MDNKTVEKGWEQMAKILDKELPQNKSKRYFLWWIVPIASVAIILLLIWVGDFSIHSNLFETNNTIDVAESAEPFMRSKQSNESIVETSDFNVSSPQIRENLELISDEVNTMTSASMNRENQFTKTVHENKSIPSHIDHDNVDLDQRNSSAIASNDDFQLRNREVMSSNVLIEEQHLHPLNSLHAKPLIKGMDSVSISLEVIPLIEIVENNPTYLKNSIRLEGYTISKANSGLTLGYVRNWQPNQWLKLSLGGGLNYQVLSIENVSVIIGQNVIELGDANQVFNNAFSSETIQSNRELYGVNGQLSIDLKLTTQMHIYNTVAYHQYLNNVVFQSENEFTGTFEPLNIISIDSRSSIWMLSHGLRYQFSPNFGVGIGLVYQLNPSFKGGVSSISSTIDNHRLMGALRVEYSF